MKAFLGEKQPELQNFLNFFKITSREGEKEGKKESEGRKERENKDARKQDKEKKKRPLKQTHGSLRYRNYWVYNFK